MPLEEMVLPPDLIATQQGGGSIALNRKQYPALGLVNGEPTFSKGGSHNHGPLREAFAALTIAQKCSPSGSNQTVYLGNSSVQLLYGRNKHPGEKDCDVVGRVRNGSQYGYWLGEGKGQTITDAVKQLQTAEDLLQMHRKSPGAVIGSVIVASRLRTFEWNQDRGRWLGYTGRHEDHLVTERLTTNLPRSGPSLQTDKIYLVDGEVDSLLLPAWAVNAIGPQPWTIWVHDRGGSGRRGAFRPLRVGLGAVSLYCVGN